MNEQEVRKILEQMLEEYGVIEYDIIDGKKSWDGYYLDKALVSLKSLEPKVSAIEKPMSRETIQGFLAQGYCTKRNSKKELDADLLYDMATAILGKVPVREVTEDEIGFEVYKILTHYSPEDAKETWTGKHYQSKQKRIASSIAQVLLAKLNLPVKEKR